MRRIKLFLSVLGMLALLLCSSACAARKLEPSEVEDADLVGFLGISLSFSGEPKEGFLEFEIKNQSDSSIGFNPDYYLLERKEEETWYKVPFRKDAFSTLTGSWVDPGKEGSIQVRKEKFDDSFSEGKYRILIEMEQLEEKHLVSCEFTLE